MDGINADGSRGAAGIQADCRRPFSMMAADLIFASPCKLSPWAKLDEI